MYITKLPSSSNCYNDFAVFLFNPQMVSAEIIKIVESFSDIDVREFFACVNFIRISKR